MKNHRVSITVLFVSFVAVSVFISKPASAQANVQCTSVARAYRGRMESLVNNTDGICSVGSASVCSESSWTSTNCKLSDGAFIARETYPGSSPDQTWGVWEVDSKNVRIRKLADCFCESFSMEQESNKSISANENENDTPPIQKSLQTSVTGKCQEALEKYGRVQCWTIWGKRFTLGGGFPAVALRFDGKIAILDQIAPLEFGINFKQRRDINSNTKENHDWVFWRIAVGLQIQKPAESNGARFGAYVMPWGFSIDSFSFGVAMGYSAENYLTTSTKNWSLLLPVTYNKVF